MTRARRREALTSTPPRRVTAFAAAKINIGLRVGAARSDGYHDVCGTIHTVSLVDRLEFTLDEAGSESGRYVRLSVPGAEELETADNLVARAAAELAERCDPRPVRVRIDKSIPIAAGLGGGSADAAATLAALNVMWGAGLDPSELIEIAGRLGSDVPAIFAGGLVHISGRGERVRRLGAATDGAFVLGVSDDRIAAGDAYAKFDRLDPQSVDAMHHNDLEAAAIEILPSLAERVGVMQRAGADPVFVSGSGPTVVGVASSEAVADEIAGRVADSFPRVEVVRPTGWGVRISIGAQDEL
jgi:4-diphosphocytidyl-2-C-methyl-D-erythritol kinase